MRALRAHTTIDNDWSAQKPRIALPSVPYNNAIVMPAVLGLEPISVVPTYSTTDMFGLLGFVPDHAFYDTGAALGEASLRYPIIADWGSLSTFYVLPSFLLRQVDLVAFADAARLVEAQRFAAAAGGRVLVRTALWVVPMTFQFQLARRLTDDEALAFHFTLLVL